MQRRTMAALAAGAVVAFVVGHLTAQPVPVKPPSPYAPTARQEVFWGDLNAAVKKHNDAKVTKMLSSAAGDAEYTDVIVQKQWNYQTTDDPHETLQITFAAQQRQRQIELLQQILAELKQRPQVKP